jgi:hypothetical protein
VNCLIFLSFFRLAGHLPGYKIVTAVPAMVLEEETPKDAKNGEFSIKLLEAHILSTDLRSTICGCNRTTWQRSHFTFCKAITAMYTP